jgi:RHS repeat-associated protein
VSRLVNVTTQQTHDYTFSAFGEIPSNSAYLSFNFWNTTPYNPWSFAGKRRDPETNFLYFGLRYYDPQLARWLTTDPAGFADTHNLYTYLRNNPWKYTDPDGRLAFAIPLLVLVFGGAAVETTVVALGTLAAGAAVASICEYAKRHPQHKTVNDLAGLSSAFINHRMTWDAQSTHWISGFKRNPQGRVDPTLPEDPFNDPNLEDISHPEAKAEGHHKFKDKRTGELIEYDEAKPGEPGHKAKAHYHRPNPNTKGDGDKYLDENKKPVPKGSKASHLYPAQKSIGISNTTLD